MGTSEVTYKRVPSGESVMPAMVLPPVAICPTNLNCGRKIANAIALGCHRADIAIGGRSRRHATLVRNESELAIRRDGNRQGSLIVGGSRSLAYDEPSGIATQEVRHVIEDRTGETYSSADIGLTREETQVREECT